MHLKSDEKRFLYHIRFYVYSKNSNQEQKRRGAILTYRLVESRRTEKGVRQYTLLNLGVDFSLPREQWPDLTKRIEDILNGQQGIFGINNDIETLSQNYASRIIASHQEAEAF